ncbi:MAG: DUF6580 family putative transport protein [Phycisphaerae bacterium]
MMMDSIHLTRHRFASLAAITLAAAAIRLVPHPPNLTPIAAIALFGGVFFPTWRSAFALPLAAMLLSDLVLALTIYGWHGGWIMPFVYGSFALTVCLGRCLRRRPQLLFVAGASLGSAVLFYLVTNLGVWLCSQMYPATWQGLLACYAAAIPFLGNSLPHQARGYHPSRSA